MGMGLTWTLTIFLPFYMFYSAMGRMEPGQSPVVQRASRQRMLTKASTTGLTSGLIHLFLALAIYLEMWVT